MALIYTVYCLRLAPDEYDSTPALVRRLRDLGYTVLREGGRWEVSRGLASALFECLEDINPNDPLGPPLSAGNGH